MRINGIYLFFFLSYRYGVGHTTPIHADPRRSFESSSIAASSNRGDSTDFYAITPTAIDPIPIRQIHVALKYLSSGYALKGRVTEIPTLLHLKTLQIPRSWSSKENSKRIATCQRSLNVSANSVLSEKTFASVATVSRNQNRDTVRPTVRPSMQLSEKVTIL